MKKNSDTCTENTLSDCKLLRGLYVITYKTYNIQIYSSNKTITFKIIDQNLIFFFPLNDLKGKHFCFIFLLEVKKRYVF